MAETQRTIVIRQFIIDRVERHPNDITKVVSDQFAITRQAARNHLNALNEAGVLTAEGNTRARRWELQTLGRFNAVLGIEGLQEDVPWVRDVRPLLASAPANAVDICDTGFSEMLNNAIDHSGSETVEFSVVYTASSINIKIHDRGIGIFKKVKEACGLADEREAILELAKGKLTTAPSHHSGYGIFFTSRMVDVFTLCSGSLVFTHVQPDDDWLIEDQEEIPGTYVELTVSTGNTRTPDEVYERFCPLLDGEGGFHKTHVPIRLAQYGSERLVSRSQAKRVLSRFEKFQEVMLDFQGVESVGQAFADEIFRVFPLAHPDVRISFQNASVAVRRMIGLARVTGTSAPGQQFLFGSPADDSGTDTH